MAIILYYQYFFAKDKRLKIVRIFSVRPISYILDSLIVTSTQNAQKIFKTFGFGYAESGYSFPLLEK